MAIVRGQDGPSKCITPHFAATPRGPVERTWTAIKMRSRAQSSQFIVWAVLRQPLPRHRALYAVLDIGRECRVQVGHDAY